jgi:hypothetical protein
MKQLELAASVAPQALAPVEIAKSLGFVPVMVGTMLLNDVAPVFERVAARAEEVVPLGVLGNASGDVRVAVVPAPALSSWNDSAQEPEMPIWAKQVPAADTWPYELFQASTPVASLISHETELGRPSALVAFESVR